MPYGLYPGWKQQSFICIACKLRCARTHLAFSSSGLLQWTSRMSHFSPGRQHRWVPGAYSRPCQFFKESVANGQLKKPALIHRLKTPIGLQKTGSLLWITMVPRTACRSIFSLREWECRRTSLWLLWSGSLDAERHSCATSSKGGCCPSHLFPITGLVTQDCLGFFLSQQRYRLLPSPTACVPSQSAIGRRSIGGLLLLYSVRLTSLSEKVPFLPAGIWTGWATTRSTSMWATTEERTKALWSKMHLFSTKRMR